MGLEGGDQKAASLTSDPLTLTLSLRERENPIMSTNRGAEGAVIKKQHL